MIPQVIGATACLVAAYTARPWKKPVPPKTWQEWEEIRRDAAELAEHFSDTPVLGRLCRAIVRICETAQRQVWDRRGDNDPR